VLGLQAEILTGSPRRTMAFSKKLALNHFASAACAAANRAIGTRKGEQLT